MGNRDTLRALGLASTRVGAVTEAQLVHLGNHRLGTTSTLYAALRQLGQRRNAGSYEQHSRTILTRSSASTATDAGSSIHRLVGVSLRNRNSVGVGHRVGAYRNVTTGLENLVVSTTIHYEVLDHGEGSRAPRLDRDRVAILELTHVDLAGRSGLTGTMSKTVDVQRAHTADTLAAVVVESHGILTLVYEVVVQNIEHFEERGVGRDVLNLIGLECALRFCVLLTPYL